MRRWPYAAVAVRGAREGEAMRRCAVHCGTAAATKDGPLCGRHRKILPQEYGINVVLPHGAPAFALALYAAAGTCVAGGAGQVGAWAAVEVVEYTAFHYGPRCCWCDDPFLGVLPDQGGEGRGGGAGGEGKRPRTCPGCPGSTPTPPLGPDLGPQAGPEPDRSHSGLTGWEADWMGSQLAVGKSSCSFAFAFHRFPSHQRRTQRLQEKSTHATLTASSLSARMHHPLFPGQSPKPQSCGPNRLA